MRHRQNKTFWRLNISLSFGQTPQQHSSDQIWALIHRLSEWKALEFAHKDPAPAAKPSSLSYVESSVGTRVLGHPHGNTKTSGRCCPAGRGPSTAPRLRPSAWMGTGHCVISSCFCQNFTDWDFSFAMLVTASLCWSPAEGLALCSRVFAFPVCAGDKQTTQALSELQGRWHMWRGATSRDLLLRHSSSSAAPGAKMHKDTSSPSWRCSTLPCFPGLGGASRGTFLESWCQIIARVRCVKGEQDYLQQTKGSAHHFPIFTLLIFPTQAFLSLMHSWFFLSLQWCCKTFQKGWAQIPPVDSTVN